jgi:hypothetical protein
VRKGEIRWDAVILAPKGMLRIGGYLPIKLL